jgi:protein-S-isoprenylcysteine O-methyltransferase Ste14
MLSSIPFELGVFNLWICTAIIFMIPEVVNLFASRDWRRACRLPKMSEGEKLIYLCWIGVNIAIYTYSVFVPIALDSLYGYAGIIIFMASIIILTLGTHAYQTTPQAELITKGIYRITRNPGYFGSFGAYVGMGLLGVSWLMILLALLHFALYQITVRYEERMCGELYPEDFPGYKKRVKKNFLFF